MADSAVPPPQFFAGQAAPQAVAGEAVAGESAAWRPWLRGWRQFRLQLPTLPEAAASLLRTVIVALFVLTFLLQPFLIPSESMEHTLLVGDFLLCNKQALAPSDSWSRWIMPYRDVRRGDIIVFHHSDPPLLVKRVIAIPGDRVRIENGRVLLNGAALNEPYASYEPAPPRVFRDNFPARLYTDPEVDPNWWVRMLSLTHNGELTVPPGEYFVLGDNRNYSLDSRFWGFVPRRAIVATPLLIYFSVRRPSTTDPRQDGSPSAANGKLKKCGLMARVAAFARWNRIFHVVH